jgi:hypothetical protein
MMPIEFDKIVFGIEETYFLAAHSDKIYNHFVVVAKDKMRFIPL